MVLNALRHWTGKHNISKAALAKAVKARKNALKNQANTKARNASKVAKAKALQRSENAAADI